MVSKNILLEGLNRFHGANLTLNSDVDQLFQKISQHVINSLDPDQAQHFVGPDLDPNFWQIYQQTTLVG